MTFKKGLRAILFRNLLAQTTQDFSIITQEIPWKTLEFRGGPNYRNKVDKNAGTYTSNDNPDEICIDPHNELSDTGDPPKRVANMYVVV